MATVAAAVVVCDKMNMEEWTNSKNKEHSEEQKDDRDTRPSHVLYSPPAYRPYQSADYAERAFARRSMFPDQQPDPRYHTPSPWRTRVGIPRRSNDDEKPRAITNSGDRYQSGSGKAYSGDGDDDQIAENLKAAGTEDDFEPFFDTSEDNHPIQAGRREDGVAYDAVAHSYGYSAHVSAWPMYPHDTPGMTFSFHDQEVYQADHSGGAGVHPPPAYMDHRSSSQIPHQYPMPPYNPSPIHAQQQERAPPPPIKEARPIQHSDSTETESAASEAEVPHDPSDDESYTDEPDTPPRKPKARRSSRSLSSVSEAPRASTSSRPRHHAASPLEPTQDELDEEPTQRGKSALYTWYERYSELIEYQKEHGDCNVPQKYEPNNKLGFWVNKQRMEYVRRQNGERGSMTDRKLALLEELGFTWAKRKGDHAWDEKYQALKAYKRVRGNCDVPTKLKANSALGRWVSTQRSQYKKFIRGKKSLLNREKVDKLEDLGFRWSMTER